MGSSATTSQSSSAASVLHLAWVHARRLKNHVLGNPLIDWLDLYGNQNGYQTDQIPYAVNFNEYIQEQHKKFTKALIQHIEQVCGIPVYHTELADTAVFSRTAAAETLSVMQNQEPIIHKGYVAHANERIYDVVDFLVRSDVMVQLFPNTSHTVLATAAPTQLGYAAQHYVAVRAKFSMLRLNSHLELGNAGSELATKARLFAANGALGSTQGYHPSHAYIVGRGWKQIKGGESFGSDNSMDLAVPVEVHQRVTNPELSYNVEKAVAWIRRLEADGESWEPTSETVIAELRPNSKADNLTWGSAVHQIAAATEDLTLLWYVGPSKRDEANTNGFYRWSDPKVTAEALGISGSKTGPVLDAMLAANRSHTATVLPLRIAAARSKWHEQSAVEFYVDFETTPDINDDFSKFPHKSGVDMIFMIGCGHVEDGSWVFESFVADELNLSGQTQIIQAWLEHMANITQQAKSVVEPILVHWSPHEKTSLKTSGLDVNVRSWFDLLKEVFQAEPVVIRGCFGFGLKSVATALTDLGLVDIDWGDDGISDGKQAMVGAWRAQEEIAAGLVNRLMDVPLIQTIQRYNEIDCLAMQKILEYLRATH